MAPKFWEPSAKKQVHSCFAELYRVSAMKAGQQEIAVLERQVIAPNQVLYVEDQRLFAKRCAS